ncbi:hypothetical protein Bca4012_064516 [Brassica carinata]
MDQFSGGNWSMIPNVQAQGNFAIGSDSAATPVVSFSFPSLSGNQHVNLFSVIAILVCLMVCYSQLVEKLSDAIENGTRDQNSDALVSELNGHFDKCQQLLNSISGSLGSKTTMTLDGQKRNLEESEQLLQQRRFMSDLEVQVPTAFDPFADANAEDAGAGAGAGTKEYVHIRVQQRNGRKSLTTVQGLKKEYSYTKILKDLKKEFCCNGTVVQDSELGQVIQLQGDQRKNVSTFLVQQAGLVKKDNIKIHGF